MSCFHPKSSHTAEATPRDPLVPVYYPPPLLPLHTCRPGTQGQTLTHRPCGGQGRQIPTSVLASRPGWPPWQGQGQSGPDTCLSALRHWAPQPRSWLPGSQPQFLSAKGDLWGQMCFLFNTSPRGQASHARPALQPPAPPQAAVPLASWVPNADLWCVQIPDPRGLDAAQQLRPARMEFSLPVKFPPPV